VLGKIRKAAYFIIMDGNLTLTENAARRIKALREKQGNPGLFLRLSVDSGGCSGMQYKFDLDDAFKAEEDLAVEREGARLVVDKTSLGFVAGGQVDFISDLSGESFQVKNPNADSSCGCGTSFSVKI
jgi:iron-sulfur cluster assembly accessory protein